MRRILMIMSTLVLLALVLAGTGCKDGVPQTELDRFITEMSALEEAPQMVKLHELAQGGQPDALYANYMIGNHFYLKAGEEAHASGWNGGEVNALLDSAEVYFNIAVVLGNRGASKTPADRVRFSAAVPNFVENGCPIHYCMT